MVQGRAQRCWVRARGGAGPGPQASLPPGTGHERFSVVPGVREAVIIEVSPNRSCPLSSV